MEDDSVSSLKPLLMVAVLAGIGYGVYCRLNSAPSAPPAGVVDGWDTPPDVQFDAASGGASSGSLGAASAAPEASRPMPTASAPGGRSADPRHGMADAFAAAPAAPRDAEASGARGSERRENWTDQLESGVPSYADRAGDWAADPAAPFAAAAESSPFQLALAEVRRELDAVHLREAHQRLSQWYYQPDLSASERQQLTDLLDQLAGTVVYSTQHWLEPAYIVRPGDRLEDIAQKLNVPWNILANINGIANPKALEPGETLKVMRGPFHAVISLDRGELTLWLGDSYAGRFPCGFGREYPAQEGEYRVTEKNLRPVYRGNNRVIGGDDPANPFGGFWISLENQIGIHGTNEPQYAGRHDLPGSITLGGRDIADVYDMLSVGSKVTVRR